MGGKKRVYPEEVKSAVIEMKLSGLYINRDVFAKTSYPLHTVIYSENMCT